MKRREFLVLGGTLAASSLSLQGARAQPRTVPVIGFLHSQSPDGYDNMVAGFQQGLKEQGFVEGQNVAIEYRWAHNDLTRLPALAAELVRRPVALLVASGGVAPAVAAKAATSMIPIVFANGADPVRQGLVASLNRPGGNITGVTFITTELGTKRLGLLAELVPQSATVGYLHGATQAAADPEGRTEEIVAAGGVLGRQVVAVRAEGDDLQDAFTTFVQQGARALLIGGGPLFVNNRAKLAALAARHKLPTMYPDRVFAVDGGLISYGTSIQANYHHAGVYAGRILKGDKPADLPVQQSVRFEMVLNLKTARALGLKVPDMLLALADEVIE